MLRSIGLQPFSRTTLTRASRRLSTAAGSWHVAIIGSGPAGYYTADQLLKGDPDVKVDIYERLPVPYGLVRYGVAPDHQEVKNVTLRFEQIASDPRCTLLANVSVGERGSTASTAVSASVPLATLREQYHAVVLAYGADSDRTLGLPGEDLSGVHSARQFVEWYNGHPLAAAEGFSLRSCETAVVIGHGNVALDCARVLSSTPEQLVGETDIAARAAAELAESNVRQVVLLGRRGVQHAAFTIKELRELSKRAGSSTRLLAPPDAFAATVMEAAAKERPRKRLMELMQKMHASDEPGDDGALPLPPSPSEPCAIDIQFQRSPVAFLGGGDSAGGEGGRLRALRVQQTQLEGAPSPSQRASVVVGSEYDLPCGLALRAVGYRSSPLDGAPFDDARGIVPNRGGRVDGCPDLYAAGWLKRGPTGVILTNVADANETAANVLADRAGGKLADGGEGGDAVRAHLALQAAPVVGFDAWRKIDEAEVQRGATLGRVRDKVTALDEMLALAVG